MATTPSTPAAPKPQEKKPPQSQPKPFEHPPPPQFLTKYGFLDEKKAVDVKVQIRSNERIFTGTILEVGKFEIMMKVTGRDHPILIMKHAIDSIEVVEP